MRFIRDDRPTEHLNSLAISRCKFQGIAICTANATTRSDLLQDNKNKIDKTQLITDREHEQAGVTLSEEVNPMLGRAIVL